MKLKRIPHYWAGALLVIASSLATGSMHTVWASPGDAPHATQSVPAISPANAKDGWVCPMHAEVHQHAPGKCPICKMKLVKVKPRG
ncbi:MAG TPA: heavy metal-binding domain-containing protein [Thiobacillus sp.]